MSLGPFYGNFVTRLWTQKNCTQHTTHHTPHTTTTTRMDRHTCVKSRPHHHHHTTSRVRADSWSCCLARVSAPAVAMQMTVSVRVSSCLVCCVFLAPEHLAITLRVGGWCWGGGGSCLREGWVWCRVVLVRVSVGRSRCAVCRFVGVSSVCCRRHVGAVLLSSRRCVVVVVVVFVVSS